MPVVEIQIDKLVGARHFDCYVVSAQFMHGDADHYEIKEVVFPLEKEELMIEFLNWLPVADTALGEWRPTAKIDRFHKFADEAWYEDECDEAGVEFEFYGLDEWPANHDAGGYATFCGAGVSFFDGAGMEFSVKQICDGENS